MVAQGLGRLTNRALWRRLAPLLTWALLAMTFSGWVAVVAGWYTTEIGRQPWLVFGVLKTAQAAGPVPAPAIGLTLAVYLTLYLLLTAAYVAALFRIARKGTAVDPPRGAAGAPGGPSLVRPAGA